MAQHDYNIANQTFPATRTDINNVLSAIVGLNSGLTAPSTTFAYMLWYDTTNDVLKIRNADNDAWISVFDFDQTTDTVTLSDISGFVTLTGVETLTNKTLTDVILDGGVTEETGTMPAGSTPAIDPTNGTVQEWTLTANSSPTDSLADGEFVELLIQDGTAYTITWPTITWLTDDGTAPTLKTTGVTPVLLQKVGTTLYGRRTGDGG